MTNHRGMTDDVARRNELRVRFFSILLDRLLHDPFPSTTVMDHIERSMVGPMRDVYVAALLSRIEDDEFPSPDALNRVALLLQR